MTKTVDELTHRISILVDWNEISERYFPGGHADKIAERKLEIVELKKQLKEALNAESE
jgi:hypothetical protein